MLILTVYVDEILIIQLYPLRLLPRVVWVSDGTSVPEEPVSLEVVSFESGILTNECQAPSSDILYSLSLELDFNSRAGEEPDLILSFGLKIEIFSRGRFGVDCLYYFERAPGRMCRLAVDFLGVWLASAILDYS